MPEVEAVTDESDGDEWFPRKNFVEWAFGGVGDGGDVGEDAESAEEEAAAVEKKVLAVEVDPGDGDADGGGDGEDLECDTAGVAAEWSFPDGPRSEC